MEVTKLHKYSAVLKIVSSIVFLSLIIISSAFSISYTYGDTTTYIGGHRSYFMLNGKSTVLINVIDSTLVVGDKRYKGKKYDTPYGTLYDLYFYSDDGAITGNISLLVGDFSYSYVWNIYSLNKDKGQYILQFSDSYGSGVYKALGWLFSGKTYKLASDEKSSVTVGGHYQIIRNMVSDKLSSYEYIADDVYGPIKEHSKVFPYINASISSCKGSKTLGASGGVKVLPFVGVRSDSSEAHVVGIAMFIRDDTINSIMSRYSQAMGVSHLSPELVGFSNIHLFFGIYKTSLLRFINWATDRDSRVFWNPTVHFSQSLDWIGAFLGVIGGLDIKPPVNVFVNVINTALSVVSRPATYSTTWHVDFDTGKMMLNSNEFLPIVLSNGANINDNLWRDLRYVPNTHFVPIYGAYIANGNVDHVVQVEGTVWLKVNFKVYWQGSGHSACTAILSAPIYINTRFRGR